LRMARRRYFFFLIRLKLGRNRASTHSYDEADDDDLPSVRELLQTPFLTRALTKPSILARNRQHVDKPASDATSIYIDHTRPGVKGSPGRESRLARPFPCSMQSTIDLQTNQR